MEVDSSGEVVRTMGEGLLKLAHDPEFLPNGNVLVANHDKPPAVIEFNPNTGAVESHLYSTHDQTIHVKKLNKKFSFKAWETIQTEQSFKYTLEEIENLAVESGFEIVEHLFDSRKYFVDSVWKVKV